MFAGALMLTVLFRQHQIGGFKRLWWLMEEPGAWFRKGVGSQGRGLELSMSGFRT